MSNAGVFDDLADGEAKALRLVKMMSDEGETMHTLTIRKLQPDLPPLNRIRGDVLELFDLESFVSYAKHTGNHDTSIVVYDHQAVRFIQNRFQTESVSGYYGGALLYFRLCEEAIAWKKILQTKGLTHKAFLQVLRERESDIEEGDFVRLIEGYTSIETTQNMVKDSGFGDDRHWSVSFTSKTKSKRKHAKLLKRFLISIPLLYGDLPDWSFTEIYIDIEEPEKPDSNAVFNLRSPELEKDIQDRIKGEIVKIKDAMPNWLILCGRTNADGFQPEPNTLIL